MQEVFFTFENITVGIHFNDKKDRFNNIITTIYTKETTNDIYLNWKSFAPTTWRRGTLKTLSDHAYLICSSIALRKKEIDHLKKVFHEKNYYPKWVIN